MADPTLVHVILSGIISIIPQPEGYLLRLQDARNPPAGHMEHYPSLLAELPRVSTQPPPYGSEEQTDGRPPIAYWQLANGEIVVENAVTGVSPPQLHGPLLEVGKRCTNASAPCNMAKKDYLGAELLVTKGTLDVVTLEPGFWRYANEPETAGHRLAQEVCWTFTIPDSTLRLRLAGHSGGTWDMAIAAPASGQPIELRLQNTLEEDFFPSYPAILAAADPHADLYCLQDTAANAECPLLQVVPAGVEAALPNHQGYHHRLTATDIADHRPSDKKGLRVNCPPALWAGEAVVLAATQPAP